MSPIQLRRRFAAFAALIIGACAEQPTGPDAPLFAKAPAGPTVTATDPGASGRGVTLDVRVLGTGFDQGSRADFLLAGTPDPKVRTNNTRFIKATELIANITIDPDALAAFRDVAVTTTGGKKGIGTEKFIVTPQLQLLIGGTVARGVNQSGEIVGKTTGATNCIVSALPRLWRADGDTVSLPLGTRCAGDAFTVNESGLILGWLFGGPVDESGIWRPSGSGYLLEPLPLAPDGTRPITNGGLNDAGEVVGWTLAGKLYWWSSATGWVGMTRPNGGTSCKVNRAFNNTGAIAATCVVSGVRQPYIWQHHTAIPALLPRAPGSGEPVLIAMNNAGVIVGGDRGRPARWTPAGTGYTVQVLADLGAGGGAEGISSDGVIAGSVMKNSFSRPVFWTATGALTLLSAINGSTQTGSARDVELTPSGLVIVGGKSGESVRWLVP